MSLVDVIRLLGEMYEHAANIKEEDKEFLNDIDNRLCGDNTICISSQEVERMKAIHTYLTA